MKTILLLLFLWAGSDARTPDNKRLTSNLDEAVSFLKKAMQKIENANDEVLKNGHNIAEKKGVSNTDSKTENGGGEGAKEDKPVSKGITKKADTNAEDRGKEDERAKPEAKNEAKNGETKEMSIGNPISTNTTWNMYADSKLILATPEEIFEFDFPSQSWKRHKVTSGPKAIYFVNDSLTWVSETKVGIYNDNFEAKTLVKLQYPAVPIAVDRESGVAYLKDIKRSIFSRVDLEKRTMLKNFYLPSSFTYLPGIVRKKKLHMLIMTKGGIQELIVPVARQSKTVTGRIQLPIHSSATYDPFKDNCVLYVANLHLMEFCVYATTKKLAAIPGPIKYMQVNKESILLVGHADVYIYNRSSAEVKTLPRPENLNNNFTCGLIYKKPKDAIHSEEHMEGNGSGDENGTSHENDKSKTYGSSGDHRSSGNYAKSKKYGTDATRKVKRNKKATVKDKPMIQGHLTRHRTITKDRRVPLVRNIGGMSHGTPLRRARVSRRITRGGRIVPSGTDGDQRQMVMNDERFGIGSMKQGSLAAKLPAVGAVGLRRESMRHARRSSRSG